MINFKTEENTEQEPITMSLRIEDNDIVVTAKKGSTTARVIRFNAEDGTFTKFSLPELIFPFLLDHKCRIIEKESF